MITLYTKPLCTACEQAKEHLRRLGAGLAIAVMDNSPAGLDAQIELMAVLSNNDVDLDTPMPILVFADTPFVLDEAGQWQRLRGDLELRQLACPEAAR